MLRVTQQDDSAAAKRYYSSADYLSEGQEIIGFWGGRDAQRLGLEGVVDKESFERLCDNLDPRTGKQLTARTRSERTVGYDFTFSVPKSVSLVYALSGDEQIMAAFREAVDETMRDIEAEMQTRVRKGGKDENRVTGNMLWSEFIHKTARPIGGFPDPHLHAHCFAFNATFDEEEQSFKAGQFRDLKRDAPYFQAAFRVRLAEKLQDLGFGIVRKRDDFELAGVPAALLKRFSRRTEEVEKAYEEFLAEKLAELGHGEFLEGENGWKLIVDGASRSRKEIHLAAAQFGITDPDYKGELGAKTREGKTKALSWDQLRKEWNRQLSPEEREVLASVHRRDKAFARQSGQESTAVDHAIAHCFERDASVSERKLLTEALKRGIGAVTLDRVKRELARRSLIRAEKDGRAMVSTWEMKQAESKVVDFGREGRGRYRPLGDAERPFTRTWLNDGQKAAVKHVLASRDAVTIIRGAAGTGKTTLEEELGEALREAGHAVVATAPRTGAVDVLRDEAGFAGAVTLAHFLKSEKAQDAVRGGVVLVDEAGVVSTKEMGKLFDVLERIGARAVLVGDRQQNRAVAAGEPLKLLEQRAGLAVAEVTEVLRQSGDYKNVAQALNQGRLEEAFAGLDRLKWIKEVPDGERYQAMADAYLAASSEKKKNGEYKTALCVSPTHAEIAKITAAIRDALKTENHPKAQRLGEEKVVDVWVPTHLTEAQRRDAANYESGYLLQFHQNAPGHKSGSRLVVGEGEKLPLAYADRFEVYRPAKLALAERDRVRVTSNGKTKDGKHKLKSGALYTVEGFDAQGRPIIDHGWVVDNGFLSHGYAVTADASQGRTVDKVFVGLADESMKATNRRRWYVALTRGKELAHVFTDSKEELLQAIQRPDEKLSATELAELARPKAKLRQRLKKLLAYHNRCATFVQTHDTSRLGAERAPGPRREMEYAR
jgi:conjugative relaxase-like TrwC/TraI family protein